MAHELMDVVLWKVPSARCVVRGDTIALWEGPGDEPSPATLERWTAEYATQRPIVEAARQMADPRIRAVITALYEAIPAPQVTLPRLIERAEEILRERTQDAATTTTATTERQR